MQERKLCENLNLALRTQCETYATSSTVIRSMYSRGKCYVARYTSTALSWANMEALCTDFPNVQRKHLAFPNNDPLLNFVYAAYGANLVSCWTRNVNKLLHTGCSRRHALEYDNN